MGFVLRTERVNGKCILKPFYFQLNSSFDTPWLEESIIPGDEILPSPTPAPLLIHRSMVAQTTWQSSKSYQPNPTTDYRTLPNTELEAGAVAGEKLVNAVVVMYTVCVVSPFSDRNPNHYIALLKVLNARAAEQWWGELVSHIYLATSSVSYFVFSLWCSSAISVNSLFQDFLFRVLHWNLNRKIWYYREDKTNPPPPLFG